MKKFLIVVAVVAAVTIAGTAAFAARHGWGPAKPIDVNAFKQFQKDTLTLRDEMMVKAVELRNEFAKEKPDRDQIAKLRTEMQDLRTKIKAAAEKNGLPEWGPGMGRGFGEGGWGRGRRMMGRGHGGGDWGCGGPGAGPGAGRGDCPCQ